MLPNDRVTYLVGTNQLTHRPLPPYDDGVCRFLGALSADLLSADSGAAGLPDVTTFAFWCRRANLERLKREFADGKARLGLGLAFHVAPSNVPVNFAFSLAFGLLSGNANVVRVPSKKYPQVDVICSAIRRVLDEPGHAGLRDRVALVRYEADDAITGGFSVDSRVRIIWGSDATVRQIKKLPMAVRGVEVAFPDRYSFCIMDADKVDAASEAEVTRLADGFYNDTYLMDQNACSSPHLIVWTGEDKSAGKSRFWAALENVVAKKYSLAAASAVDKYVQFCNDTIALESFKGFRKHENHIYRAELSALPRGMDGIRGKFGYFYEYDTDDLGEAMAIVNEKYQTLTYFGVDKQQLLGLVLDHRVSGIDRIVPVGKALDIGVVWDGYDIIKTLSRVIDV